MPVYEFNCNACGANVSIFVRSINAQVDQVCDRCGSRDLRRLMSRFAVLRPLAGSAGGFDESMFDGVDENDPRSVADWARRMQQEVGEDMGPEFDDVLSRMERGEMPADDFGAGADDFGGMDEP